MYIKTLTWFQSALDLESVVSVERVVQLEGMLACYSASPVKLQLEKECGPFDRQMLRKSLVCSKTCTSERSHDKQC